MARRQGFFDELMIVGSKLPWRVTVFSAAIAFAGLHIVAVQTSSPATGTTLSDLGWVAQRSFIHVAAALF
jgi:hypothetical protein